MKQGDQLPVTVSVIVPVYNHARWVKEALESVIAQTGVTLELIIIDDASSDNSWGIVQEWSQQYPHLCIYLHQHKSNLGAPATLNEGLQRAQGDYLAILNSDDVWQPNRLARLLTLAENEAFDFIATDVMLLDADSQRKEAREPHWSAYFAGLKQDLQQHQDLSATLLRGNLFISTSNFFWRRSLYQQVGGFAELRYVHDYEYLLRVLLAQAKVHFVSEEVLLGYRLHDSNTIREQPRAAIAENMRMLVDMLPHLLPLLTPIASYNLQHQLLELYRYTEEEWLSIIHWRLVAKEQELVALIADRDGWIQERDHWILERDNTISRLQQQVTQLQAWLQEREQWIADRDQWIIERDASLAIQQQLLTSQAEQLQRQASWIADRDRWITERDGWIAERDGWIAERDTRIQELQQQLQHIQNSRALRWGNALLTPLRLFKQWSLGENRYA